MPPSLLVLFNHALTPAQQEDAMASLGVNETIFPPGEIRSLWSQVPPSLEGISEYLAPVRDWLVSAGGEGDYVLVQGEFGATYLIVRFCMEHGLIPIYATTRREAVEERRPDGSVELKHRFAHVRFRLYGR